MIEGREAGGQGGEAFLLIAADQVRSSSALAIAAMKGNRRLRFIQGGLEKIENCDGRRA